MKQTLLTALGTFLKTLGMILAVALAFFIIGTFQGRVLHDIEVPQHFTPTLVNETDAEREWVEPHLPVILQVNIQGEIGLEGCNAKSIARQLSESRKRSLGQGRVKALVLRINSPGGSAIDSDIIYRQILQYKQRYELPVYAYVDGYCASGAMYIAAAADKIYCSPSSVVGSIGVLLPTFNFSELMSKVGVSSLTLTEGKYKDDLNPFRPIKEGEAERVQALTRAFYDRFVSIIVARRGIARNRLVDELGAQVFPAEKAIDHGLADELRDNYLDVLADLKSSLSMEDAVVVEMKGMPLFSQLFMAKIPKLISPTLTHEFNWPGTSRLELSTQEPVLYLYKP